MTPITDYGPAVTRDDRGAIHVLRGAAEIEIVDRPDPDAPQRTVRGARRYDALDDMRRRGSISESELVAAERFRTDCAQAAGARGGFDGAGGRTGFNPSSYGPSDAQIDAQTRARKAWQAIGMTASGVMAWVLLGNASLRSYVAGNNVSKGAASKSLRDGLARLADHYAETDGQTCKK